jgi:hypothetical protein
MAFAVMLMWPTALRSAVAAFGRVLGRLGVDDGQEGGGVLGDGRFDGFGRQLVVDRVERGAEFLGVGLELGDGGVLAGLVALGGGLGVGDELGDVLLAAPQAVEGLLNVGAVDGTDGGDDVGGVAVGRAVEGGGERLEGGGVARRAAPVASAAR